LRTLPDKLTTSDEYEARIVQLEAENAQLRFQYDAQHTIHKKVNEKLAQARAAQHEAVKGEKAAREQLRSQTEIMNGSSEELTDMTEKNYLRHQVGHLVEENKRLQDELRRMDRALKSEIKSNGTRKASVGRQEDNDHYRQEILSLNEIIETTRRNLEKERQSKADEIKKLVEQLSGFRSQNRSLREDLNTARNQLEMDKRQYTKAMQRMEEESMMLKESLGKLEEENGHNQSSLKRAGMEIESLEEQLRALQIENARQGHMLDDATKTKSDCAEKLTDAQQKLEILRNFEPIVRRLSLCLQDFQGGVIKLANEYRLDYEDGLDPVDECEMMLKKSLHLMSAILDEKMKAQIELKELRTTCQGMTRYNEEYEGMIQRMKER
jgi:chromosome segregation ATPase